MRVFKHEIDAGLADALQGGSIAYELPITHKEIPQNFDFESALKGKTCAGANPDQIDLFYIESILASVGWNLNDDVFDPYETFAARNTPVDKQVNYEHNESDIIGHITSSYVVDHDGNRVSNTIAIDSLPTKFDVVVGSVLYTHWEDEALKERMQQIVANIKEGKLFVSMECLFPAFDYAVITPDGEHKTIARTEESSFLTKHLRIYGGQGSYEGHKVGRLLRNFSFSGKGIVFKPANPRSDILSFNDREEVVSFAGSAASVDFLCDMEKTMAHDNNVEMVSKAQFDALQQKLEAIETENAKATNEKIDALQGTIDELTSSYATLETEFNASKEVAKAKDEKISALESELAESKEALAVAEKQIADIEAESVATARKAQLVAAGMGEEKADETVTKFAGASDEMFEALVDSLPKVKAEESAEAGSDSDMKEKDDENKEDKKAEAAEDTVEDAQADEGEVDLASAGESVEDEASSLSAKASAWFTGVLRSTQNNDKE